MGEDILLTKPPARKVAETAQRLRALIARMQPGERTPSFSDLERQLGVSRATINTALNVLRAEGLIVTRPGSGIYVAEPDPAAPRSTSSLTVITYTLSPFAQNCAAYIVAEAYPRGLDAACHFNGRDLSPALLDEMIAHSGPESPGFVFVGSELDWAAAQVIARGVPAVAVGEPYVGGTPTAPTVYADAEQGGQLVAQRLLGLGHRRFAFVHTFDSEEKLHQQRRWECCVRTLEEAGVTEPRRILHLSTVEHWRNDLDAARQYFSAPDAPTALLCWTDSYAVTVLGILHRAGLRVPEEISVIGYDNVPIGADTIPPLDTVDQHLDVQIRHALSLLEPQRGRSRDRSDPLVLSTALVTPTLITRGSCAPASGAITL